MRFPTPLLVAGLRAHPANQDPNRPTDHHEQASGARHPTRRWWAPTAVGATAIAMAVLATAAPALAAGDPTTAAAPTSGHVYWATIDLNGLPGTIGRANLNGTMVNQSFIPGATQPSGSQDVTVDATHIYWADQRAGTIGRANLDGTGVDPNFITGLDTKTLIGPFGNLTPAGVAVDAGHIYWTSYATGTIGRANLDGTRVHQKFITGAANPIGVAVDAGHVYWTNNRTGAIGQANLDGTGVNQTFIGGLGSGVLASGGMAVDAAHVYWTNGQTIGRANLDGTTADPTFITGAGVPGDVDVDAGHVYWSNQDTLTPTGQVSGIGRANLDGTRVNPTFITVPSTSLAQGVAVDHTATP
jgi:virginiamycin B lyase